MSLTRRVLAEVAALESNARAIDAHLDAVAVLVQAQVTALMGYDEAARSSS